VSSLLIEAARDSFYYPWLLEVRTDDVEESEGHRATDAYLKFDPGD
jgi:hypothetical protein